MVHKPIAVDEALDNVATARLPQATPKTDVPAPPPESESDDPSLSIPANKPCRRRGCNAVSTQETSASSRDDEECVFHPGQALFHEGSKGWTCCKRRVLEFDEFMKIEGCKRKKRHMFIGSGKKDGTEESLQDVRYVDPSVRGIDLVTKISGMTFIKHLLLSLPVFTSRKLTKSAQA